MTGTTIAVLLVFSSSRPKDTRVDTGGYERGVCSAKVAQKCVVVGNFYDAHLFYVAQAKNECAPSSSQNTTIRERGHNKCHVGKCHSFLGVCVQRDDEHLHDTSIGSVYSYFI